MASIFTYDPDPPRISSPWILPENPTSQGAGGFLDSRSSSVQTTFLSDYGITKLEPEPQSGPTEYKLHLLLRPRRNFLRMGIYHTDAGSPSAQNGDSSWNKVTSSSPASSNQPRQQRLQHLTTQLLWRLQQSSPYHASSSRALTIPKLPADNVDLNLPLQYGMLVPGLEESRGALYELGVCDDGSIIGLTQDEMHESISTLAVMAASLGCKVEVSRMVIVGDCEWFDPPELRNSPSSQTHTMKHSRLWVAEILITPNIDLKPSRSTHISESVDSNSSQSSDPVMVPSRDSSITPQLRVTLTGPTTSGKSSLLGTLSTGTLDNGRGKSRLSLLKHRHEMASGVTSSIAQELIGYQDKTILNFSQGNIDSWVDIHDYSERGRLVFVSDSGGHPRYWRTVLRGLINWAPHWSILCVAANDADNSTDNEGSDKPSQEPDRIDLAISHLSLSLKLNMPMVIVITKLDIGDKLSLHKTMVKVLAAIKDGGRIPKILQPDQQHSDCLDRIPEDDWRKVEVFVEDMTKTESWTHYVPIVLTSALKGTGIGIVHALLATLPIPARPLIHDYVDHGLNLEQPNSLFHIDDIFSLSKLPGRPTSEPERWHDHGIVLSGYVRLGSFSVGERIILGPFPMNNYSSGSGMRGRASPSRYHLSRVHSSAQPRARPSDNASIEPTVASEWHHAVIKSIRNLRLPVRTLQTGQIGSIGLLIHSDYKKANPNLDFPRIRRGMILAVPSVRMLDLGLSLKAASGFTAVFHDATTHSWSVGSFINVFMACIRAVARVLHVNIAGSITGRKTGADVIGMISLSEIEGSTNKPPLSGKSSIEVSLEFLHCREWVELGSQVVIMDSGSRNKSGLEVFVGKIVDIVH